MNIGNYLQKKQEIILPETKIKNNIIIVISELFGITLERSKITVSRDVVTINGSSALKNEIALKQVKILARMKVIDPELKIKKVQ